VPGENLIEAMLPGRRALAGRAEAIGERLAVIGEDLGEGKRGLGDKALK
jgi:hypothetical protein